MMSPVIFHTDSCLMPVGDIVIMMECLEDPGASGKTWDSHLQIRLHLNASLLLPLLVYLLPTLTTGIVASA